MNQDEIDALRRSVDELTDRTQSLEAVVDGLLDTVEALTEQVADLTERWRHA